MTSSNLNKSLKEIGSKRKKIKVRYGPFYLTKENVEALQDHCREREIPLSEILDDLIRSYLDLVKEKDAS